MKLEMDLKPGDILLLKVLGSILILVLCMQLLVFPGLRKQEDLNATLDAKTAQKEEMEETIAAAPKVEEEIAAKEETLQAAQKKYSGLLENQEIDELLTGIVLNHSLFPVSLQIAETEDTVPEAYFLSSLANAGSDAAEESSEENGLDSATAELDGTAEGTDSDEAAAPVDTRYVHTTNVSLTLRGDEVLLRSFLNDLAVAYPQLQVRSFQMQEGTYLNENLAAVDTTTCTCVIAVYTCGDTSDSGEEKAQ